MHLTAMVLDPHSQAILEEYRNERASFLTTTQELTARIRSFLDDAGITVSGNQNNTRDLNELMKKMMRYVESTGAKEGLRYWEYTQGGYSDQAPLHASH